MAGRDLSPDRQCTCGSSLTSCLYWSDFVNMRPGTKSRRGVRILESAGSLLLPMFLLKKLMMCVYVDEGTSYSAWLQGQVERAAQLGYAGMVDTSKSTREAAGRPVLYAALGIAVEMYLPRRPLRDVVR